MHFKNITIDQITPNEEDLCRIEFVLKQNRKELLNPVVYIVCLIVSHPKTIICGHMYDNLAITDTYTILEHIDRHSCCDNGLYFKVYDPQYFSKYQDAYVSFVSYDQILTSIKLPKLFPSEEEWLEKNASNLSWRYIVTRHY